MELLGTNVAARGSHSVRVRAPGLRAAESELESDLQGAYLPCIDLHAADAFVNCTCVQVQSDADMSTDDSSSSSRLTPLE
eukprot:360946-Chlamydomonas_euryale.AAC.3